jgi:hypothetical protein
MMKGRRVETRRPFSFLRTKVYDVSVSLLPLIEAFDVVDLDEVLLTRDRDGDCDIAVAYAIRNSRILAVQRTLEEYVPSRILLVAR